MKITRLLVFIIIQAFIFSHTLVARIDKPLDLHHGRLFVVGSLGVNYEYLALKNSQHSFDFNSNAGVGYLLLDNIAIGASLPTKLIFYPAFGGQVGLSLFATYFFRAHKFITPYAGFELTPAFSIHELAFKLIIGASGGILLALTENIALDFSIAPKVHFPLSTRQQWKIEIPAGFIGIRAFF